MSVADQGRAEDELLDEYLVDDVDDLGDEDGLTIEEILDMDLGLTTKCQRGGFCIWQAKGQSSLGQS